MKGIGKALCIGLLLAGPWATATLMQILIYPRHAALALLLTLGLASVPDLSAAASLEELLIKKGVITKDELEQIKAEEAVENAENEQKIRAEVEQYKAEVQEKLESDFPVKASWGKKGFQLETRDGNWLTQLQWRLQTRYTYPYTGDPRTISHFRANESSNFEMRRMRMKIGGHGYRPWIEYYFEVDLQPSRDFDDSSIDSSTRLIDWRITLDKYKWATLRFGQWKIDYNRERVDSSGKQQFVERSIVNRQFTIDRQIGALLKGRVLPGTFADFNYYAGVFSGKGRSVTNPIDDMMWMGRFQWNFLGRELKWEQSDTDYTEKPTGSLSFAVATGIGPCTRFSSGGCGNLDGFARPANADDRQFKLHQMQQGFAFKWRGFSVQEEFHWKTIEDRVNNTTTHMTGSYAQVGYFFHNLIPIVPKPLELAFRYAFVDEPNGNDISVTNTREEFTTALNWFFAGHNNKVTLDFSHLKLKDRSVDRRVSDQRVRLQWDISF